MKDNDVIISTRIRFARNLKDYPFASRCDEASALEIIEKVENALGDSYKKTDFSEIAPETAQIFVEHRRISPAFANVKLPHGIFEKEDTVVMVCEEDHIRLQVIKKGFCLEQAFEEACGCDDRLTSALKIAYDSELGYLTHCPTNLGSGMRASVMAFLPALSMTGELNSLVGQLSKLGFTVRGMYGEGSQARGYLYQISNSLTMGTSEEKIINNLSDIITRIITFERNARDRIKETGIKNEDRISRCMGTLLYASLLSSAEFVDLYARVRMGISMGIIENIDYETLDELFMSVMPASVSDGKSISEEQRDALRAAKVKECLRNIMK